jgi:surfactin synthase thioesterase subunit
MRLFCFPYAGGGASVYHNWGRLLPDWLECLAIKLPGREDRIREQPLTSIDTLVDRLVAELLPVLNKPFAFYGHSMGAILALEVALRLRRSQGPSPCALFLSAYPAPTQGPAASGQPVRVQNLSDSELLQEVLAFQGTPSAAWKNPELLELVLPVLRADFALCDTHVLSDPEPLECPLTVFGGWQDPKVTRPELERWRSRTAGRFEIEMLPGDHFFLSSSVGTLLPLITGALERIRADL